MPSGQRLHCDAAHDPSGQMTEAKEGDAEIVLKAKAKSNFFMVNSFLGYANTEERLDALARRYLRMSSFLKAASD